MPPKIFFGTIRTPTRHLMQRIGLLADPNFSQVRKCNPWTTYPTIWDWNRERNQSGEKRKEKKRRHVKRKMSSKHDWTTARCLGVESWRCFGLEHTCLCFVFRRHELHRTSLQSSKLFGRKKPVGLPQHANSFSLHFAKQNNTYQRLVFLRTDDLNSQREIRDAFIIGFWMFENFVV